MTSGWIKARITITTDDNGDAKIVKDSGVPNDTHVIGIVRSNVIRTNLNSEWVWQECVMSATLIPVEVVGSCDLAIPPSPVLESSANSLTLSNEVTVYMSETISKQNMYKDREPIWIQPIKSLPVKEVWLSPTHNCAEEQLIQQFLEQIYNQITKHKIIVRVEGTLQFNLNSSHDQVSSHDCSHQKELWFDVLQVLPIAQGHLTKDTKIIVVPPLDNDSDTDSDNEQTYDTRTREIKECSDTDDTEDEDYYQGSHDLPSLQQQSLPRQPLLLASQIRLPPVATETEEGKLVHIFTCLPLCDFPAEKNFILVPLDVREKLGCFGLENLLVSPAGLHANQGMSFVAIIEDFKGKHTTRMQHSTVYVHPEVYFNLFPFPVDHITTHHMIKAKV